MYSEDMLFRLVERIYDAAIAPELWPAFLEALAEVMDGHLANLAHTDARGEKIIFGATARFDPEARREYDEHYATLDPWFKSATAKGLIRTGEIELGQRLVSANDYQKTGFYNDFGRGYGFDAGLSVILRMDHNVAAAVSVTQRGREFGDAELALVRRLLPHLQRALQIHERLTGLAHQRSAAEEVIDRLPFGVVLVDASGRAVLVNRAAQQILDCPDGLMLRDKSLVTTTVPQTTELRTLIAGAIAVSRGELLRSGGALAIGRPSLKRQLQLLVTPLRTAGASSQSQLSRSVCRHLHFRPRNANPGGRSHAAAILWLHPCRDTVRQSAS